MIAVRKLVKAFGLMPVLRQIDLSIAPGDFVLLLGPNGSGKTTLLRILAALARPTVGRVQIAGYDLPGGAAAVRSRLGVVLHQPLLYGDLTAAENLRFYARLYGLHDSAIETQIEAGLVRMGLAARANDLVRTYSRGMQQRLALLRATLHDPDVYLLDEPYTGLDRAAAAGLDAMLSELTAPERAIIMTTHDMIRGVQLANRVVILAYGRIAHDGPAAEIDDLPALYAEVTRKRKKAT
jgi:heme exporter protein A